MEKASLLYDFTNDDPKQNWIVVNDNVMGGRSDGGFSFKKKYLIFSGNADENEGCLSSSRTKPVDCDLGDKIGLHIRYKGYDRTDQLGVRLGGKSVSDR